MSNTSTSQPKQQQPIVKDPIFDLVKIEELCDQIQDESDYSLDARVTYGNGNITLVVYDKQNTGIDVYHTEASDAFFKLVDAKYIDVLENDTCGSDFWDSWYSLLEVLTPFKIAEDIFTP
jgi:hypothetical protein